jgi:hypothetical protein
MDTNGTREQAHLRRLAYAMERAGGRIGIPQERASRVLQSVCETDQWVAVTAAEVVSGTGQASYEALARLLWMFGVGSIVEGRID